MKHIVSISLGSSSLDYSFKTRFLGENFTVERQGTDRDRAPTATRSRRHN
jgi:hypothetical protein